MKALLDILGSNAELKVLVSLGVILVAFIVTRFAKDPSVNPLADPTSAPKLYPYHNPITFSILLLCIGLIGGGAIVAFGGSFWGIPIALVGVAIWVFGNTDHPVKPRTAGLLTFWDTPVCIGKTPVVVGGRTILANYFPFFLNSTQFEITNQDRDFPVLLVSRDNVVLPAVISVTNRPDITDSIDYLQAGGGKMEPIFNQIDDIVSEKARGEACQHDADDLVKNNTLVSGPLRAHLIDLYDAKEYGCSAVAVQANISVPEEIQNAMNQGRIQKYLRDGQMADYRNDFDAAQEMHDRFLASGTDVPVDKCLKQIKQLRALRDGRYMYVKGKGVVLTDAKLNMGAKQPGNP